METNEYSEDTKSYTSLVSGWKTVDNKTVLK